jgi:hypothetical protein
MIISGKRSSSSLKPWLSWRKIELRSTQELFGQFCSVVLITKHKILRIVRLSQMVTTGSKVVLTMKNILEKIK